MICSSDSHRSAQVQTILLLKLYVISKKKKSPSVEILFKANPDNPRDVQKSFTWGGITPSTQAHRGAYEWEVAWQEKTWRSSWETSWTQPVQQNMPTFWVALASRLMEVVPSLRSARLRPLCTAWTPWVQDRHTHTRARVVQEIKALQCF